MAQSETVTQRIGQVLKDRYRIERVLHAGAAATIYAGTDRKHGKVAIKVLPKTDASVLRRSYLANAVGHPSVVNVLDTGVTEDRAVFLVMELLEAKNLLVVMREHGGRLPVRLACNIADQCLDLLACAHAQGITHGALRPSELFITSTKQLKVLGFGNDRLESLEDKPNGPGPHSKTQEDVHALAVSIAWLLAGEPVAPLPPRVTRTLPRSIALVFHKALSPNPAQRWKSAVAMRAALRSACQTELGRPADPAMPPTAATSQRRRAVRLVWLTALSALLIELYYWPESRSAQPAPTPKADTASATDGRPQPARAPTTPAPIKATPEAPAAAAPDMARERTHRTQLATTEPPRTHKIGAVRKPALPELRMRVRSRPGLQLNIAPSSQLCGQLSRVLQSRRLTAEEEQLWSTQCTKR